MRLIKNINITSIITIDVELTTIITEIESTMIFNISIIPETIKKLFSHGLYWTRKEVWQGTERGALVGNDEEENTM